MISALTHARIQTALRDNDIVAAGNLSETAISTGEQDEMLYSLAVQRRLLAGDGGGAIALTREAAKCAPLNPTLLAMAGDAMRTTGQLQEAITFFDKCIAIEPFNVSAWYGRALALASSGNLAEAALSFEHVCELAPDTAPGFAGLASVQARNGDIEAARQNAERAAAISPDDFNTILGLACCDTAAGQSVAAAAGLRRLAEKTNLPADDRVTALGLLGDTLDSLGEHDAAFDCYARANAVFAKAHVPKTDAPAVTAVINGVTDAISRLTPAIVSGTRNLDAVNKAQHVFLLGFPRSGTTLVEQVLATIPGVQASEEAPTFGPAHWAYFSEERIAELWSLDNAEIEHLRDTYWQSVATAGITLNGGTYVDMDPFKGAALPLIARLFPRAKIVIVRRDPRDTVWSCFRRNFVHSPSTYELSSLTRAANYYAATMGLMGRTLETFELDHHTLHYEDLVRDFDQTTKALCTFLKLPWGEDLRDFSTTARAHPVKTVSANQVRKTLFDGTGQWKAHAKHLEPIMPVLLPWIRG